MSSTNPSRWWVSVVVLASCDLLDDVGLDDLDPTAECTNANDAAVEPGQPDPDGNVDDDVQPAPPSIGADIPLTYFGPPPSSVNPRLVGPKQLLTSGTLDLESVPATITLPLYQGRLEDGVNPPEVFWYVVTDTTDEGAAAGLGLNFSAKLVYARDRDTSTVRFGTYDDELTLVVRQGRVDFSPVQSVVPGAVTPFPPSAFSAGSVGDADYSPLVGIANAGDEIYNAPIVAFGVDETMIDFCDGNVDHAIVHDKVTAICPSEGTATFALTTGFSFGRPVAYLSLDAFPEDTAALEAVTYAPALSNVTTGADDSLFSPVERLFAFTNGPVGVDNPQRQGLNSALSGEGSPLNVFGGIPTLATDYSPLWDVNAAEWTQTAIDAGYRAREFEEFRILGLVEDGHLTGPLGAPFGSTGSVVNCPIVHRFL